jgi:hypothetical protein
LIPTTRSPTRGKDCGPVRKRLWLANVLAQVAMGATSRRKALDVKMDAAKENSCGNMLSTPLMLEPACCTERGQAIGNASLLS